MKGASIDALNQGLHTLRDGLVHPSPLLPPPSPPSPPSSPPSPSSPLPPPPLAPLASRRVEVAIVTFDSTVKVVQDFVTADQFEPPTLTVQG